MEACWDEAEILEHAFITSCYPLLPTKSLKKLQGIQNVAARILTTTKKRDNITPVLATLHW